MYEMEAATQAAVLLCRESQRCGTGEAIDVVFQLPRLLPAAFGPDPRRLRRA